MAFTKDKPQYVTDLIVDDLFHLDSALNAGGCHSDDVIESLFSYCDDSVGYGIGGLVCHSLLEEVTRVELVLWDLVPQPIAVESKMFQMHWEKRTPLGGEPIWM